MPKRTNLYEGLVDEQSKLESLAIALARDDQPIAIDAERASGYRYYQRAYLVQLHHREQGTWLIDPTTISDVRPLAQALSGREWVLHAATQDLPCLAEMGLKPDRLFDTELGGRLLGMPRVALAVMLEDFFAVKLAKQHSAVDWSLRPLPEDWLEYAALDVAYLLDLRDRVDQELDLQLKASWAQQEFEALLSFSPAPRSNEPWRKITGLHLVTDRRVRATARELWYAREAIAQDADIAPGRVLSNKALLEIAAAQPKSASELARLRPLRDEKYRQHVDAWWRAISSSQDESPPPTSTTSRARGQQSQTKPTGKPTPEVTERLNKCRSALRDLSEALSIPPENLSSAAALRAVAWLPVADLTPESIRSALAAHDARRWQIELVAPHLLHALQAPEEPPTAQIP